jgi:hypothetical protein
MAKVWLVKEGNEPTAGEEPLATVALADCIQKLGLREENYRSRLDAPPQLGNSNVKRVTGPRYVVVEVDEAEANAQRWKPGFYLLDLSVQEALTRLQR